MHGGYWYVDVNHRINIKNFVRYREVVDFQYTLACANIVWLLIIAVVPVFWRHPFPVVLVGVSGIITIESLFLYHHRRKGDLFLASMLYLLNPMIPLFELTVGFLKEKSNFSFILVVFIILAGYSLACLLAIAVQIFRIRKDYYKNKMQYGVANSDGVGVIGAGAGGIGYFLGDIVDIDILMYPVYLFVAILCIFMVYRCTEYAMIHYCIRKYHLQDQVRVRHQTGR